MKKNESNAIEVDFTEVIESPVNQDVTVKPKKASLKILTTREFKTLCSPGTLSSICSDFSPLIYKS